jgi:hypothetical protein
VGCVDSVPLDALRPAHIQTQASSYSSPGVDSARGLATRTRAVDQAVSIGITKRLEQVLACSAVRCRVRWRSAFSEMPTHPNGIPVDRVHDGSPS